MTRTRTVADLTELECPSITAPDDTALAEVMVERQRRIADEVRDMLFQKFPMIPPAVIAALIADAVDWLDQAGDVVTIPAVRTLVVEALTLRLGSRLVGVDPGK